MRSLSAERNAFFVRILIANTPRMYREVLALSIHRRRPDWPEYVGELPDTRQWVRLGSTANPLGEMSSWVMTDHTAIP
jgi:hypothetical protein